MTLQALQPVLEQGRAAQGLSSRGLDFHASWVALDNSLDLSKLHFLTYERRH